MHQQLGRNLAIGMLAVTMAAGTGCNAVSTFRYRVFTRPRPEPMQISYSTQWDEEDARSGIQFLPFEFEEDEIVPKQMSQVTIEVDYPHPDGRTDCGQARVTLTPIDWEETSTHADSLAQGDAPQAGQVQGETVQAAMVQPVAVPAETWTMDLPLWQVVEIRNQQMAQAGHFVGETLKLMLGLGWYSKTSRDPSDGFLSDLMSYPFGLASDPDMDKLIVQVRQEGRHEIGPSVADAQAGSSVPRRLPEVQ